MKFSIVTCTLNSADWLAESLRSVDQQQGVTIERIYVDGGSSDGTLPMLEALPGDVKLLRNIGGGISRAMNAGIEAATGEVVAHLHSDDIYVAANTLLLVQEAFQRQPDRQWLYGRCMDIVNGGLIENNWATKPFSGPTLLRNNIVPHPATFVRRELLQQMNGFREDLTYTMDYDLWLRLAKHGLPIQLNDYLAAFRRHEGSLSTRRAYSAHLEGFKLQLAYAGRNWPEKAYLAGLFLWRFQQIARRQLRST